MHCHRTQVTAAFLVVATISLGDCAVGQETQADAARPASAESIAALIGDLDGGFQARLKARTALENAGDAAIEPLRKALPTAGLQARQEIERLLKLLEQDSVLVRAEKLAATLSPDDAKDLPEWDRYRKLIDDEVSASPSATRPSTLRSAIRFYVRMLKAEPALFGEAQKGRAGARRLSVMLEARASELVRQTEPRGTFSIDSYAALLLISGDNAHRLPGQSSYNISAMLLGRTFTAALESEDGPWLKSLAGQYILRSRIGLEKPLEFAYRFPLPAGLQLARQTLTKPLRGTNGVYAMRVLREHGAKDDIAFLQRLFKDTSLVFQSVTGPGFKVTNGDVALASAIVMQGGDPRDFGFAPTDDRSRKFRFIAATTGFVSEDDRLAAQEKYFATFPTDGAAAPTR